MAASRTTRRGTGSGHGGPKAGAGWGGAAKGHAPRPLAPAGDEYSDAVRAKAHDLDILANAEQVKAQMRAVLYDIALAGEAEAVRVNAADKLLDRLEGKAVVKQDVTSKGERIGYVIPAPPEAEDAEAWTERYKPR